MEALKGDGRRRRRAWAIIVALLGALALATPAAPSGQPHLLRAQPELQRLVASAPDQQVRIIVQLAGQGAEVQRLVPQLGGAVIRDLSLINAFVASVPARSVARLAAAPEVRWVSLDAPIEETNCSQCVNTGNLLSSYIQTIGADRVWNDYGAIQGQGVTVAVVDTGFVKHEDLRSEKQLLGMSGSRVLADVSFSSTANGTMDTFGHGTHVAGIIGGNGARSDGRYIGVAPRVNLVNVKVGGPQGVSYMSDVVAGLQWIYLNRLLFNIRVVNLSVVSTVPESYHTSPLNAAVEILWFNSVVVVAAAGNGAAAGGVLHPPANDPFIITVGAIDDMGTADWGDDVLAAFSPSGLTESGFSKPDLLAPGVNIVSTKCGDNCTLMAQYPGNNVAYGNTKGYFRMSGTSMAAAVTSGAVALLLSGETRLTPDQVKYRLMQSARPLSTPGAGVLDIYNALHTTSLDNANSGITISQRLSSSGLPLVWNGVWNSVSWNAVNWNSVTWNPVNLDTLHWGQ